MGIAMMEPITKSAIGMEGIVAVLMRYWITALNVFAMITRKTIKLD